MAGKTISHYKVIEKIVQGGVGEVNRAEDINLSSTVGVNILPEHVLWDVSASPRLNA